MDYKEQQNSIDIKENYIKYLDDRLLKSLLKDKSSDENIIWATDMYSGRGIGFFPRDYITVQAITGRRGNVIKPRIQKSKKEQKERIKTKGEVFTPSWICNEMANALDDWFGRQNVFNTPDGFTWHKTEGKIEFPEGKTWQDYVRLRVLEITCGEAPFLASRYDTVTGEWIDVNSRVGLLDRKLRVINENASTEDEWVKAAFEAYQSTYGFEWQGDSLLIARENLLFTFIDYYVDKFGDFPPKEHLLTLANILAWNIFQMDGQKYVIPYSCQPTPRLQMSIFDDEEEFDECEGCINGDNRKHTGIYCQVKNWRTKTTLDFYSLMRGNKMKFDFVIGNPPYQDDAVGDNKTYTPQIYNVFLDGAYILSDKVEMIHPARFLFNAGSTPKKWNEKMLNDKHLKVCAYFAKSSMVFPNTNIMGGVAITYRDTTKDFGAIEIYSAYPELNSIKQKVVNSSFESFGNIVFTRTAYRLTDSLHEDYPEAISQLSNGHPYDMSTNIFERLPQVFFDECPKDGDEYVRMFGLIGNVRGHKYIKRKYVKPFKNLDAYKVFIPAANGSAAVGSTLPTPVIGQPELGEPAIAHTETFISVGSFETKFEAEAALKYSKSKFARTMLGILKITQHNSPSTWRYVPMQDFTEKSDIDWNKSVHEIDLQLYKKYGLGDKEISFIETHVKEMD